MAKGADKGVGETKSGTAKSMAKAVPHADSDEALWHLVAETIKPLKSRRRPAGKKPPLPTPPLPAAPPPAARPAPRAKRPVAAKPPLPELSPAVATGTDKRTAQRLVRGQLAIEARLDLHGLTQDEAHGKLAGFIRRSVAAGKRCVLVITGKGYKPTGEIGVLRRAVPRWLNEPSLRRDIVALRHAQPKDGGDGALYVLLRRERETPVGQKATPAKRLMRKRPAP